MLTRACQIVMNDASKNMKGYWKTTVIFVISLYWFSYILKKLSIFVCKGKKSGFRMYIYIRVMSLIFIVYIGYKYHRVSVSLRVRVFVLLWQLDKILQHR